MLSSARLTFMTFWWRDRKGLAATEFALIFPFLFMLLLGVVELGQGIMANQKAIMASQIVADLITRSEEVTDEQLEEAKRAGRLALNPFDPETVGFDIISFRYDPDDADSDSDPEPVIVWRETDNMDEMEDVEEKVQPLALVHDGVVLVYVRFPYQAAFGSRFVGNINMIESTFSRGRRTPVVERIED